MPCASSEDGQRVPRRDPRPALPQRVLVALGRDPLANPRTVLGQQQPTRGHVGHEAGLADNAEVAVVHVELASGRTSGRGVGRVVHLESRDGLFDPGVVERLAGDRPLGVRGHRLGADDRTVGVHDLARDVGRVAVEGRVFEQDRGADVVDDLEAGLALVGEEPRAATDDLLELHHRADGAEQDDELQVLDIHPGRQQAGRRRHDGADLVRVGEVAEQSLLLALDPHDAHHPFGVGGDQVGVLVDEGAAHLVRVLGVDAEHDAAGGGVAPEDPRQVPRGQPRPGQEGDDAFEVARGVDALGHLTSQAVEQARGWLPALGVRGEHRLDAPDRAPGSRPRCPGAACTGRRGSRSTRSC